MLKVWQIILCIVFGLGAVVFGAECVSTTAQFLAIKMGMSEALVGLTIVAIGTESARTCDKYSCLNEGRERACTWKYCWL